MKHGAGVSVGGFEREFASSVSSWLRSPAELFSWGGARFEWPFETRDLLEHADIASRPGSTTRIFSAIIGDRVAGHAELTTIDTVHGTTVMRRVIVDPELRRRGVGRMLVQSLLGVAFDELGLHRVELRVFDDNLPAIQLYRVLGFTVEGRLREYRCHDGVRRSALVLGMLEDEWRAAAQRPSSRRTVSTDAPRRATAR